MQHDAAGRSRDPSMRYRTFSEYVQMREGLLLPDRPVTLGGPPHQRLSGHPSPFEADEA
jgi:hypothetical protein